MHIPPAGDTASPSATNWGVIRTEDKRRVADSGSRQNQPLKKAGSKQYLPFPMPLIASEISVSASFFNSVEAAQECKPAG